MEDSNRDVFSPCHTTTQEHEKGRSEDSLQRGVSDIGQ